MDIFSLLDDKNSQEEGPTCHADDAASLDEHHLSASKEEGDNNDDDDLFETPMSTPRSLFSTPPRSPSKTPSPRPSSHVDNRIRMRQYKLSMTPSPVKSRCPPPGGNNDMLCADPEDPPLCHRMADISFSSAGGGDGEEDWMADESNEESYPQSPGATPNNSPRKSDLLSLSPIHERLERARTKRQAILEERVQNIDNKSAEKQQQARKNKEDATLEKVSKARTEESIILAKSKRQQILDERVQQIDVKSKEKEEQAIKRKEDVEREKIEKARSELAKSPAAKERREQQLALRVQSVEATLESKTALAERRLERHLFEKQQRACCRERAERAERRRKLISYEKRAKLLASLDAKLERAALKSHRLNEEKAIRAGEDILKAKEVARRVKAARVIQGAVRDAYGLDSPDGGNNLDLSQHDAAERLQIWSQWRAHVCKNRLFAPDENTADGDAGTDDDDAVPKATKALKQLLQLFPLAPQGKQHRSSMAPPFEEVSQKMMQPETLKLAILIVDCLRPINEVSFGASDASNNALPGSSPAKSSSKLDGRTLLSLALIAIHPREVLGDDFDKPTDNDDVEDDRFVRGSRLLASSSLSLLQSLNELVRADSDVERVRILDQISSRCLQNLTLFSLWKSMDLEQLLAGLSKQLEQSWVVYLTSSETLKYLAEVTGVDTATNAQAKRDDPLMSLRLRHEAGRSGSRSHIKRIRLSLNKLIGAEEGKETVTNAKMVALKEIEETNAMENLKGEIDEIYGGLGANMTPQTLFAGSTTTAEEAAAGNGEEETVQNEPMSMPVDLPDEILSNIKLVHRILLTDPSDFDKLSWDGANAQSTNVSPDEFMASFVSQLTSHEQDDATTRSMEDMPLRIAQSMRMAFFNQMAQDMAKGNYESVCELLKELHSKMRSLLPSRKDLHSHINDEDVSSCSSTSDILRVLIRSGYLLANYLEAAARAPTTQELIGCLEAFVPRLTGGGGDAAVPYGVESEELFAVASITFVLQKAELAQMDVSNFKLSQSAPIIHHMGHDYERKHLQKTFGDYSTSSSIEEMQQMLPSTWSWVEKMRTVFGDTDNLTVQSNMEQKMDFLKGRGFVDGILFTRSQLALPELLSLDVENINHIRSEARCCVIASALVLHACNISKVGTSVLSSSVVSDEVNDARQALSLVLRNKYFQQDELESDVVEAIVTLTKALAERDLSEEEVLTLKNHTFAVLHGNDPVLKLLDNRVQSFFRFACKWKSDVAQSGSTAPLEMKTGRSVLRTDSIAASRHGINSTKEEFSSAAKKEVSRLGFAFCGPDLINVGNQARHIISLACTLFGPDILYRFLGVALSGESNM